MLEYRLQPEAGSGIGKEGSCCRGPGSHCRRLLEYRHQLEAGRKITTDGSCCPCPVGRGLHLLEYPPLHPSCPTPYPHPTTPQPPNPNPTPPPPTPTPHTPTPNPPPSTPHHLPQTPPPPPTPPLHPTPPPPPTPIPPPPPTPSPSPPPPPSPPSPPRPPPSSPPPPPPPPPSPPPLPLSFSLPLALGLHPVGRGRRLLEYRHQPEAGSAAGRTTASPLLPLTPSLSLPSSLAERRAFRARYRRQGRTPPPPPLPSHSTFITIPPAATETPGSPRKRLFPLGGGGSVLPPNPKPCFISPTNLSDSPPAELDTCCLSSRVQETPSELPRWSV
jgi:hypothetical protein